MKFSYHTSISALFLSLLLSTAGSVNFRRLYSDTARNNASEPSKCPYNFTVFVYPTPAHLSSIRIAEEARMNRTLHVCKKCILEQFSLEYIIYDFFVNFCGRTSNPYEADFFYIPMVRDAELRWLMEQGNARDRPPFPAEKAMLDLLEKNDSTAFKEYFQVSDRHWRARDGADHIIVMPAPVTNFRHERGARGFFHYMLHLLNPIFVAVEYSKSFIAEYPVCSRRKNILAPYPTVDPELFSRKWHPPAIADNRSSLFYYSGGLHGDCMEVREALQRLMKNSSRIPGLVPPKSPGIGARESGFLTSTFCPIPIGDSPSSKRMYDVMNFGCIPVILSDDLIWAYSLYSGGSLNDSLFALQMPQSVVQFSTQTVLAKYNRSHFNSLPVSGMNTYDLLEASYREGGEYMDDRYVNPLVQIMLRIPYADVVFFRRQLKIHSAYYRYYKMQHMSRIPIAEHKLPDGEAIDMLARMLERRKTEGTLAIRDACAEERDRKDHVYIARYPCDYIKKGNNNKKKKKKKE